MPITTGCATPANDWSKGFTVRVYDAAGTLPALRTVTTDANGAYTVPNLPAGVNYQIEFRDRIGNVVYGLAGNSRVCRGRRGVCQHRQLRRAARNPIRRIS